MKSTCLLVLFGICCLFAPLSATTIVPFVNLGETTRYSGAVVLALALYEQDSHDGGMTFRDMQFQVTSVVKGPLTAGQEFALRPESSFNETYSIDIAGDFAPEAGKTYLLWLTPHGNAWRAQMLSYYVFEEIKVAGHALLEPLSGSGIEAVQRPDGVAPEPLAVYERDELLPALRLAASGTSGSWNAAAFQHPVLPASMLEERTAPGYCDFMLGTSTFLCRWQNPALNVYYNTTNVPAGFSATLDNILTTMKASYTAILPVNAGPASFTSNCTGGGATTSASNFTSFCNTSLTGSSSALIIFDDPCNEIDDLIGCAGVLAKGGSFAFLSTHTFKSELWRNAAYGFVIVNNGVLACQAPTQYQQLLTHELTHAYRLDHISTTSPGAPGQNMNPICCNAINTLDVDCMNYSYDIALPVELTRFTAKRKDEKNALISWTTATETDNGYFSLEHSADGKSFSALTRVPAHGEHTGAQYEWIDNNPFPAVNYYWLLQYDLDGRVTSLGLRTVRFETAFSLKVLPSPVPRKASGALEITAARSSEGVLEIVRSDGRVEYRENLSLTSGQQQFDLPASLPAGTYRAVLRTASQVASAGFSKE